MMGAGTAQILVPMILDTNETDARQLLVVQQGQGHALTSATGWLLVQPGRHHMAGHAHVRCLPRMLAVVMQHCVHTGPQAAMIHSVACTAGHMCLQHCSQATPVSLYDEPRW